MPECTCHDVLIVKDLNRWFKEKWVDVSRKDPKTGKHPPCGRSKAKKGSKGYPKCRPSVRVSSKTPKTSGEMTSGQKRAATKRKRAKKQGVGGKPTIVKSPMDLAWRLLKEDITDYFKDDYRSPEDESLGYKFNMELPFVDMNERQKEVAQAALDLPDDYLAEEGWNGEVYQHLFTEGHEQVPDHEYEQAKQAIKTFGDYIRANPSRERSLEEIQFLESEHFHPDHPWERARNLAGRSIKKSVLVKAPVSPEAKRHKLEYDKKYESTPERVKYREELNRERRRRGIYGHGGPDMSHTKDHTLVAESPHANRARHFKERGTLKG